MMPAAAISVTAATQIVASVAMAAATMAAVWIGYRPVRAVVLRREAEYASVLRGGLLIDVAPRAATLLSGFAILALGFIGYGLAGGGVVGAVLGGVAGLFLPSGVLRVLRRRRLRRLEDQLVPGIQTLASGVRAGLNLVQAMGLVARDGPIPLKQEFAHLLREYEYGVSLEEAMNNAARRIGSSDFGLLFAALLTHRERGGDLGLTLDRIAESIREIQRLEKRVQTLTAQGRATARWLGAMPVAVLVILYFLVDPSGVERLFADDLGKLLLGAIVLLNILGFLWIRKIVTIDI